MYEIELKYRIDDVSVVLSRLLKLGAVESATELHEDTYYRHPCRDFAATGEALRIRRIDGMPFVTYKGAKKMVSHGDVTGIKLRRELEWALAPADHDGAKMAEMLTSLGFSVVATVIKQRRPFEIQLGSEFGGGDDLGEARAVVTIDCVNGIGDFAEIEVLCENESEQQRAAAAIGELAGQLGVAIAEPRSYLSMVLALD